MPDNTALTVISNDHSHEVASVDPWLLLLKLQIPASGSNPATSLLLANNNEDVTYAGEVYSAFSFDFPPLEMKPGELPQFQVQVANPNRMLHRILEKYKGGNGGTANFFVVSKKEARADGSGGETPGPATIGFRAARNADNTSSITLPTVADGDLVVVTQSRANHSANDWNIPTGWNVLYRVPGAAAIYRIWKTGDPTSLTFSAATGNWPTTGALTYIGVDPDNPIDYAACTVTTLSNKSTYAPSIRPRYDGGVLLAMFHAASSSSNTIGVPSALTKRVFSSYGSTYAVGELALPTGTKITSVYEATNSSTTEPHIGAQVVLRAARAVALADPEPASPYVAGRVHQSWISSTSITANFTALGPQDGDVVVVPIGTMTNITPTPTGWTLIPGTNNHGGILYKVWHIGDATTVGVTIGSSQYIQCAALLLRKNAATADPIVLDASAVASDSAVPLTLAIPSIEPVGTDDLMLWIAATENSPGGTWSGLPSGYVWDLAEVGPNLAIVSAADPSAPTATGTIVNSATAGSGGNGMSVYSLAFKASTYTPPAPTEGGTGTSSGPIIIPGDVVPAQSWEFEIFGAKADDKQASIILSAGSPMKKAFPALRCLEDHCNWIYNSPARQAALDPLGDYCRYQGDMTSCSHTKEGPNGCKAHGNISRFGGHPGIDTQGYRLASIL